MTGYHKNFNKHLPRPPPVLSKVSIVPPSQPVLPTHQPLPLLQPQHFHLVAGSSPASKISFETTTRLTKKQKQLLPLRRNNSGRATDMLLKNIPSLDIEGHGFIVIGAGLWSASLGLAFNPNDHASCYSVWFPLDSNP